MKEQGISMLRALLVLVLMVAPAVPASADDTASHGGEAPDMAVMMEAIARAAAPGEHHEFMSGLAGDWVFTSKVWMDPSQPPMESPGTSKKTMIMGGRYLQEEVAGEMAGNAFTGLGVLAFDNTGGEFIATWIDSMSTGLAVARGQREGDTLTLHGDYLDPASGQSMKVRQVTRFVDENRHVFEYYMTPPGAPEMKSMVIEYVREGSD